MMRENRPEYRCQSHKLDGESLSWMQLPVPLLRRYSVTDRTKLREGFSPSPNLGIGTDGRDAIVRLSRKFAKLVWSFQRGCNYPLFRQYGVVSRRSEALAREASISDASAERHPIGH